MQKSSCRAKFWLTLLVLSCVAGCSSNDDSNEVKQTAAAPPVSESQATSIAEVVAQPQDPGRRIIAADTEPGNWLSHGRTYLEQRYSPLAEINVNNVEELGLAWYFDIETKRGIEATPLIVDGVMYVTGAWSIAYALDAAPGKQLWRYDPEVPGAVAGRACCDAVNRGVAWWGDTVYFGTLDDRLIALNAPGFSPMISIFAFVLLSILVVMMKLCLSYKLSQNYG
jgi:glucose dehydrogenase